MLDRDLLRCRAEQQMALANFVDPAKIHWLALLGLGDWAVEEMLILREIEEKT